MFFEDWQEYITEMVLINLDPTHYYRMKFPNDYKCDSIYITKFEKSYRGFGYSNTLTYQFMRAFPKNVSSVPVAYGQSEFTKVTVEFAYDRYIVNPQRKSRNKSWIYSRKLNHKNWLEKSLLHNLLQK